MKGRKVNILRSSDQLAQYFPDLESEDEPGKVERTILNIERKENSSWAGEIKESKEGETNKLDTKRGSVFVAFSINFLWTRKKERKKRKERKKARAKGEVRETFYHYPNSVYLWVGITSERIKYNPKNYGICPKAVYIVSCLFKRSLLSVNCLWLPVAYFALKNLLTQTNKQPQN